MKTSQKISTLLIITIIALASCSSKDENISKEKIITAEESADNLYTITVSQFNSSKMEFGEFAMHEFHKTIKANGMFDVPPENKASVSAYFGGYVKEIHLLPGHKVKKGQVLFTLENPDYVQIQQEFLEAKGLLSYLKSDYERQKNLVQDNVTSQKNYLKAEADYTITQVKYESLKKKLRLMNINPDKLNQNNLQTVMTVLSPISGYVTNVNVTKGMYLAPSDVGITIIDMDHMHLELIIFENDLAAVAIGQPIKFKTQNDSNQEYEASVFLVNKSIDPKKRTLAIHGHLKDKGNINKFTPGMYIEAEIFTSTDVSISLPIESVVNMEDKHFVLIKKGTQTLEKRQVTIGKSANGFVEILNHTEFDTNTQFLTKGAFNLITD